MSNLRTERLIEFRFFTNVYLVLNESSLNSYKPFMRGSSFRLFSLVDGEPSPVGIDKKTTLTRQIESQLGLKLNANRSSNDIVLLKRTGQPEILTLRLPRAKHKREALPKGALRPELAHILLLVAAIKPKDVLLDPFAGYGSVPLEAVRGFGLKQVTAIDKDAKLLGRLARTGIRLVEGDAANLDAIPDSSIDKIVTDPPWGIYTSLEDLSNLYEQSLKAIDRVLKSRGVAVILSGNEQLDQIIKDNSNFELLKSYKILVSGKKAHIIKLQKTT